MGYARARMTLLRHREDRLPVALFFLFFAADFAVYWTAARWWVPVLWFALTVIPKGWVCAWNHHHQHLSMFRPAVLNRLLELGFALQTGVTTNAWTLHHVLGHHVHYLDPKADESGWMNPDGSAMGLTEYTWKNTLAAYPRIWKVGEKYPKHRRLFVYAAAWTAVVVALLIAHNPYNALFVYVLPMVSLLAGTVWVTWFHHANLHTNDPFHASNNTLDPLYNLVTGNLGYHTAHHQKQALHWSKLPALHAEIAGRIPASNYLAVGIPFSWFQSKGTGTALPPVPELGVK
jgi:fatty acid desaturase